MFVNRLPVSEHAKNINFNFINDKNFGMINLFKWVNDVLKIENPDAIVIKDINYIDIYYPVFKHHYVMKFIVSGIEKKVTFLQLIKSIIKTGKEIDKHLISDIPMNHEYAIKCSMDKGSDIKIDGNKIYVQLQH